MEGFLNLQWTRWKRVLLTRTVAILPTFLVAFYENIVDLSSMNDLLNCLMSLMLPFALIPTVTFSSCEKLMGKDFSNGKGTKVFSILVSGMVIAVNMYFVLDYISTQSITNGWSIFAISIAGAAYLLFCVYLTVDMIIYMGVDGLLQYSITRRFFNVSDLDYTAQLIDSDEATT